MKRSIQSAAVLLALVLLLTTAGCRLDWPFATAKEETSSQSSSAASSAVSGTSAVSSIKTTFSLPVVLGKNLNPLKTDSMINLTLWPLLYDCLAEPDSGYTPQWCLASSADQNGTTVTVHLRSGVTFSDGSALTAQDVLYSYNEVRGDSSSFFYSDTANIANITSSGSYTVVFTLKSPDALFANLLTVPIIKSGSDAAAVSPGGTSCPIGSGRYTFSNNDLNGTLTANKNWYKGKVPAIQTIRLVNMLDSSATFTSLKTGVVNYLYADASGATVPAVGLSTASVSLNRMVFLGVNWSNSSLANVHIRRALSLGIDRASIVLEAFSSRASASLLPFNPAWAALQALPSQSASGASSAAGKSSAGSAAASSASSGKASSSSAVDSNASGSVDRSQVQNELTAAGISIKAGSTAPALTLRLLVNSGSPQMTAAAQKIVSSLASSNIAVTVDSEPAAAYAAKLSAGQYDLYLGEIRLTDDMDITPLFHGGSAGYGAPAQSQTQVAFSGWQAGSVSLASLTQTFRSEMPFIPLCFRLGTVAYSTDLKGTVAPTYSDVFRNAESWHFD